MKKETKVEKLIKEVRNFQEYPYNLTGKQGKKVTKAIRRMKIEADGNMFILTYGNKEFTIQKGERDLSCLHYMLGVYIEDLKRVIRKAEKKASLLSVSIVSDRLTEILEIPFYGKIFPVKNFPN